MRRGAAALTVALLVAGAGCGGSGVDEEDVEVGRDLRLPATTEATAAGTTARGVGGATTVTARSDDSCPPPPANTSDRTDGSGLRLGLTVGNATCYPHGADIPLQLAVTNTGDAAVFYDANQRGHFAMRPPRGTPGPSWLEGDCLPRPGFEQNPAGRIEPGQRATFEAVYPGRPGQAGPDPERCRKPAGEYEVTGSLRRCPPRAMSGTFCDPQQAVEVVSQAVRVTIGEP